VFGADHQATYPVVLAVCKALGGDISKIRVLIHQFVTVKRAGREVRMSKRKGEFFTLDQLLDEVGLDAARYFYLLRVSNSHLAFDIDLALKESEENPVFYVQYGHARIAGVLRHAHERGYTVETAHFNSSLLTEDEELALIKVLLLFPEITNQAYQTLEPQKITVYMRDVATAFHQFYQHHRIIGDNHELSQARTALVLASKTVLSRGLGLLGVSAPDRM
jgi:arginyl-tRNA synthetase